MNIVVALLVFGVIIVVHELGHFLLAKKNGIFVTEFSIGMGPRIVSFVKNETRYSLKLFPIGGSCMMLGEDESSDDMRSFGKKSVWARISVVVAGAGFNFILAFLLSVFLIGMIGYEPPIIADVDPELPAYAAGIRAGDVITKMDNKRIHIYPEVRNYIMFNPQKEIEVTYLRGGESFTTSFTPALVDGNYMMGITRGPYVKGNVLDVIKYSAYEVKYWIVLTIESLRELIAGKIGADDIGGPVRIVGFIGDAYEGSKSEGLMTVLLNLANITILLSANLGVMNLLPIPALDGGRLIFLLIEVFRRKPIDQGKEGFVHFIGLVALMILMVLIMFNDIRNLIAL